MFERDSFANIDANFNIKPANLSLENIFEAIKNVIEFLPKDENLPQVKVGRIIKLEEKNFRTGQKDTRKIFKLASPIFRPE